VKKGKERKEIWSPGTRSGDDKRVQEGKNHKGCARASITSKTTGWIYIDLKIFPHKENVRYIDQKTDTTYRLNKEQIYIMQLKCVFR